MNDAGYKVETLDISSKRVYLVEDHHHVLIPWSRERRSAGKPLRVLTLDHHTDKLPAFSHYIETNNLDKRIFFDYADEAGLCDVIDKLRHDEHIDYALRSGILSHALLFTHVNFPCLVNPQIQIIHEAPAATPEALREYYGRALESRFLKHNFELAGMNDLPDEDFILDIDLDYFKTRKSLRPDDPDVFHELIRRSQAITISRERDWVRLLNMDFDSEIDADSAEKIILEHISMVMGFFI